MKFKIIFGEENKLFFAKISNNLAELYRMQGKADDAEKYFLESLKIFDEKVERRTQSELYSTILNNLGLISFGLGRFEEAEKYFRESKGNMESFMGKLSPLYATILNNLG